MSARRMAGRLLARAEELEQLAERRERAGDLRGAREAYREAAANRLAARLIEGGPAEVARIIGGGGAA